MLTALLLTSLTVAPTDAIEIAQVQPPVRVWLSKRHDVERGDRVRAYVRTATDGYLLLLHAEPDGRIRVLFPLDPFEDSFIRGERDYEIEGRGGREAFRVYEESGAGTVYAAFSRDPFHFEEFVRADHWDYRLLETWRLSEELDPEAELTALAQQMAGDNHFDYDLVRYEVGRRVAYAHEYYPLSLYAMPVHFGVSLHFGHYPSWYYPWRWRSYWASRWWDPWYDPFWCGVFCYDPFYPFWYDPFYYGYRPYYYGGGYYVGYPGVRYVYGDSHRLVLRRYTFKPADRAGLANGGITVRRRVAAANATSRRLVTGSRTATSARRLAPTRTGTADRRLAPTGDASARTRVQPNGWGITDGRRVISPTDRSVQRRSPEQRQPTERPQVRRTEQRRQPAQARPERRVTPSRQPTPAKRVTPQRRPSSRPSAQPSSRSGSTGRVTPQGRSSSRPTARPSQSSATRRPVLQRRSAPSRSARPASRPAPSRAAPTRRPAPSRATPASRPAPRPAVRSPSRVQSRPVQRSAPTRSSSSARRPARSRRPN
ncbi:MAG: DUF4384 domain-containing protein [Gemmatimonadales bacterium]|nr:DUF4384 domain-containing protein [Gemmatimonadales bacterium]NIN12992.1 DUF4384 domain-containing protein [Gemmatimonadales bacterium]NIN51069.1 DUF4384 domain-containing protein [Gemmatimonadales bacterium]NIP08533.1 DUF4384 domain-containing protein [Gemmatimonadales bacterium]NIR02251.1 DUF4384 domain-containing protein [Gemmatimonadales bacterium]